MGNGLLMTLSLNQLDLCLTKSINEGVLPASYVGSHTVDLQAMVLTEQIN